MLNAEYVWRKNAEYDTFEAHFIPKAECILFKKKTTEPDPHEPGGSRNQTLATPLSFVTTHLVTHNFLQQVMSTLPKPLLSHT